MFTIRQADLIADRGAIADLFWEYLVWADGELSARYDIALDITGLQDEALASLDVFAPPLGRLLLAFDDDLLGCACLKPLDGDVGEIKRMYVRPRGRRAGVGRRMLDELTAAARSAGYERLRLDSVQFMTEAHALYRSAGFLEIDAYPGSEIPPEFQQHWIFMEKLL